MRCDTLWRIKNYAHCLRPILPHDKKTHIFPQEKRGEHVFDLPHCTYNVYKNSFLPVVFLSWYNSLRVCFLCFIFLLPLLVQFLTHCSPLINNNKDLLTCLLKPDGLIVCRCFFSTSLDVLMRQLILQCLAPNFTPNFKD